MRLSRFASGQRQRLIVGASLIAVVLLTVEIVGGFGRRDGGSVNVHKSAYRPATLTTARATPAGAASDVESWNQLPSVDPSTGDAYPAIGPTEDASGYVKAFATELLTRNYVHSAREDLISWAQSEDSPLRSPNYPPADWSKVLVESLTDLTWDDATMTPIPADGEWLELSSQQAWQTVSQISVSLDKTWEQYIADGNNPPDALASARDVTATVEQQAEVANTAVTTVMAVSFIVQVGSSPQHGGYAAAVVNDYQERKVP